MMFQGMEMKTQFIAMKIISMFKVVDFQGDHRGKEDDQHEE